MTKTNQEQTITKAMYFDSHQSSQIYPSTNIENRNKVKLSKHNRYLTNQAFSFPKSMTKITN